MNKQKSILTLVLFILCWHLQAQELTTFILLRHAEKAQDGTKDPPLTVIGENRAEQLADFLVEVNIDAIYSTNYRRTRATVMPLAEQLQLQILEYQPNNLNQVATDLLNGHRGQTVVVSGHSNTTPRLVNAFLGEQQHADLDESEYDWIYIVDVIDVGNASIKKLQLKLD